MHKTIRQRNSIFFIGRKWKNISVDEMVCSFGIFLRIGLEPRNMVDYISYFQESPLISVGTGYSVRLRGYDSWDRDIMTLAHFKKI